MAIKERKQITGTAAQIKGFAGHNGVLAYATDTKHLHVLSGTAGTTTELANRADIPDITGKADTTYVNAELAKKQAKGDYATTSALTSGLAGKANSSHTHTKSQITDFPSIPDASTLIPKEGNRGEVRGYETTGLSTGNLSWTSLEAAYSSGGDIKVLDGETKTAWTKVVRMLAGSVTLGSKWVWAGGRTPTLKFPGVLVCHWNNTGGIANYIAGAS